MKLEDLIMKVENGKIIFCDDDEKEIILEELHLIVRTDKVEVEEVEEVEEMEESEDERPEYEEEYYCGISDDDDCYYAYDDMIPDEILNE